MKDEMAANHKKAEATSAPAQTGAEEIRRDPEETG
jgi:hypothetical protein